ncbi:MAG: DUF2079 domain-containing protein [Candidatus Levybacteria bacterium]|nr:DUF2079 domain-containing protein [Candidatus Levybacteria bacterium]
MITKKIGLFFEKYSFKLLIAWIVVLAMLYSALSIVRHNNFQSGAFDLGLYDQSVWKYSQFQAPYNTIKNRFILGDHLALTLPILAPLFWIWNDPRMLLIFQAFWVSLSALPVFLLVKNRGYSSFTALCLTFVYSLFYGIQFMVFFDFHPVAIGVGLIPWLLYFLESKRWKLLIGTISLLLFTQENMGIALASLGLIYINQKQYRKIAIKFILGGFLASFVAILITRSLSPVGFEYAPQIDLNPFNLITNLFNSNEKQLVWLYSFSWFSFLPMLSPGAIFAVLLDLSQYFLTGEAFARMWSPFMHHRAMLAPFLLLGTLDAINLLKRKIKPEFIAIFMVVVALLLQYKFHFALNKLSKPIYWQSEKWMEDNRKLTAMIPKNMSIASTQNIVPHLSHRSQIYLIYPREHEIKGNPCGRKLCWWLDFPVEAKYIVINSSEQQTLTQLLESPQNFHEAVENMEKLGKIKLEKKIGTAYLYKVKK